MSYDHSALQFRVTAFPLSRGMKFRRDRGGFVFQSYLVQVYTDDTMRLMIILWSRKYRFEREEIWLPLPNKISLVFLLLGQL